MRELRIAVLVSGSGSNLQSIIDAVENHTLTSQIVSVISNKEDAFGLERAKTHHIPAYFINPKEEGYDEKLLVRLQEDQVDLVVLAGYLKIVDANLIKAYRGRIINIHPSLLPKFGGKGYYGIRVHEAVLAAGESESGATVHFVDEGVDTGKTILQKTVPVYETDTPQLLQQRVLHEVEHKILVEAIKKLEEA
ncbi:phosphoribosylglycinamide formyltransferase [Niameybacter massiliensis]|uniref:Phosphoribosylglycinamide formyltransferase n=1 Tax=Holtiella tumoricola TaxID=3018743 RepID=A0AA42DR52_9FIRM|nr:phosphoribosylglycinamide formyltransferase [Holtiella tumoricola]MDA3733844.1 phosphoribosylglycinamide formyltransferase [Holtiella tumoricola]